MITRKEMTLYIDLESQQNKLLVDASARDGHIEADLNRAGTWEQYDTLREQQDAILEKNAMTRYYEDFGMDATAKIFSWFLGEED